MKYLPIDKNLFIQNRQRLAEKLKPKSLAVLNANDIMPTSADGTRSFIQNTDIFYLSGIDQEESILVIFPDAREDKNKEVLFVRETNEELVTWQGSKYSKEEATAISGIQTIHWTKEFERVFKNLVFEAERLYLNTNEHLRAEIVVETRDARFIKWCIATYPLHKYDRLAPIMHDLRAVKSSIEIELIKQACSITEKAFRRALRFIKPGVWEFEIEAEIYHEFLSHRSRGSAFAPIIASGPNTCILHYVKNNRKCKDGDLLLMDFGAEYANYASDLTRTVPVNGKFTPRQKAVYHAVLRVQQALIKMLRPGNTLEEYHKEVGHIMEDELIGLGLLDAKDVKNQNPEEPLYKTYFMHGASHHLGLDVHDYGNKYRKFEQGMVFTCEPGIYIKKESIGIRLENDILLTNDGPVDLTENIPIEADDIEDLMNA
ncbi:MAG: aminopeptidase P N-terminal domain-containing protein [Desulfobacterales bacterium]|nr:MAG: aminopeptidase P N-terminal domain-containing protein [Desulfobacterales bacterium]